MKILRAEFADLEEILALQFEAYQSEARLLEDDSIPPLKQTIEDLKTEYDAGVVLKAVDENEKIVGSVRGIAGDGTLQIAKLIVHPSEQNKGIGKALLASVEALFPGVRYELYTSNKSLKNMQIYEKAGYRKFKEKEVRPGLVFVYMEKLQ